MTQRCLGPIQGATLLTRDIRSASAAYQEVLGFTLQTQGKIGQDLAQFWSAPDLEGRPFQILAAANGDPWLRLVQDPDCSTTTPLKCQGWMALESNVADVDKLRNRFKDDRFQIIGEPAYLQVSDAIKAMQVIGPCGEVHYLTQIERPVPPFELPSTNTVTGSLFIPVLCTPDRNASLTFYQQLNDGPEGLRFDTKVTVLNNAWGRDIEHQYPVATLQLNGNCLFEIDQLPEAYALEANEDSLPSGISIITCYVTNLDKIAELTEREICQIDNDFYPNGRALLLKGEAGEWLELVEQGG